MNLFKTSILGLLVCATFIAHSQKMESGKMQYGIGMALNYSNYHSSNSTFNIPDIYKPILGFSLITSMERQMTSRFKLSLRPEIAFIGSRINDIEGSIMPVNTKISQVNVALPLTVHYRLFSSLYADVGVAGQFVAGLVGEDESGELNSFDDVIDDRLQGSVHVGLSYVISDWVDLGLKYNVGLGSVFNTYITDLDGNTISEQRTANRYFQVAIIFRH